MVKAVNKSDFIMQLAGECDFMPEAVIEAAAHELINLMVTTLCQDGRVEVRGFGSFSLHHRLPRLARNPKTGEQVQVQATAIPHFKPGKALREQVNQAASLPKPKKSR